MKRILVTGSGGPATLSFTRSLRDAEEDFYIIGTDAMKYNLFRSEVDQAYLCPKAQDDEYIPFMKHLIEEEEIDFLHSQPEIEGYIIGKHRDEIPCKLFMPKQETIELLRSKWKSYEVWERVGIKVPKTILIRDVGDLEKAYKKFGNDIWIRDSMGAAGRGSLSRPSFRTAVDNINKRNAWFKVIASEHLTDKTITWQSIWHEGRLVVGQGRRRLYWEFGNRTQSGVTGLTGTGETVFDSDLDDLAIKCIQAADKEPHGIYSVDFTFDWDGIPNPTEINIGKFFTTHHFLTKTGCNMPLIFVQLAFDEYTGRFGWFNPCRPNMYWVRGIDKLPTLVDSYQILEVEQTYAQMLQEIRQ